MVDNASIENKLKELRIQVKTKQDEINKSRQREKQLTIDIIGISGAIAELDQMLHPKAAK